jgi:hypothetical protein
MNKRQISERIALTGCRIDGGYTVKTSYYDGLLPFLVPSVRVGNAIVRALREVATKRPDLFPPSYQTKES